MTQSKEWFRQGASLSQQLGASKDGKIFQKLAGHDPKTSLTIGRLLILGKHKIIDLEDPTIQLVLALKDVERKALFATSPHTNEISKMGLMLPKSDAIYIDE